MKSANSQAFKQYIQAGSLILTACAFIGPVPSVLARSHRVKDLPVIRVGVYNYAEINRSKLREAERRAAALFTSAGVRVAWSDYSHEVLSAPFRSMDSAPDFSVRILYASATARAWRTSGVDVLGESIIPQGVEGPVPGRIANVFYDRVKKVASASGMVPGDVLGEAIAHELGHLMLGPRHSYRGVMKAYWIYKDYALISQCALLFLPGQAEALQRAARSLQHDPSPELVAQN